MAGVAGVALVFAACGSDDSNDADGQISDDDSAVTEVTADTDDVGTDDDDTAITADTEPAEPVDELSTTELASWDEEFHMRLRSLLVTDGEALVIDSGGLDGTLVAIDLDSGEMRTNPDAGRITQLVQTATNGVYAFDFEGCTFRPVDTDDLTLGEGVGELIDASCSSGGDTTVVRGDVIWTVQPEALFVIDTTTGETRSLEPSAMSDRFADGDTPSGALLDLGDAVLVTYFASEDDDLRSYAARIGDDLDAGPLVAVPRLPRFDNGVLVDDATDDDGFMRPVVLDPLTLEVTDEEPPAQPMWGTVSCDPVFSLVAYPGPDGSVWVGPTEADGEIVLSRCLDGREVGRARIDHDQFSSVDATTDAFYYLAAVRPEPDEDGMSSFDVLGVVLVQVTPA